MIDGELEVAGDLVDLRLLRVCSCELEAGPDFFSHLEGGAPVLGVRLQHVALHDLNDLLRHRITMAKCLPDVFVPVPNC